MKSEPQIPEPSRWHFLNGQEYAAAKESIFDAGEYIESLGKTDFADFTKEEFETLCLVICNSMNKNSIPF